MQIRFIRHLLPCKGQENIRLRARHFVITTVQSLHPLFLFDPARRLGLQITPIVLNTLHEESRESGLEIGRSRTVPSLGQLPIQQRCHLTC